MTAETNAAAFKQGLYEIYRKHELATAELVFSDLERIAADIAALLRAEAAKVPEGWKLVPIEPTREMLDAYVDLSERFHSARSDWAAMLAATPPAPDAGVVEPDLGHNLAIACAAPEVVCPKCELRVISSCGSATGCPTPNIYEAKQKGPQ